jgi:beta-N-acetylhexosaminidase
MAIGILTVSLEGTRLSPKEKILLAHPAVGGVALFKENWDIRSQNPKEALKALVASIREINPDLILMVDHEGGKIWRFEPGFTRLPAAKTFGQQYDAAGEASALKQAYEQAQILASELLDCGVDLALAPVVDLDGPSNVIGRYDRAFHQNPEIVAKIAKAFIQGMNAVGMPGVLKHFPGHGSCELDSHVTVPEDARPREALEADLFPFKNLVNQDLNLAVMTNHVKYPAVDANYVAGFSKTWIDILRNDYHFDGLIMSDCLSMTGADIGDLSTRINKAQEAGNDLILVTHQFGPNLDSLLKLLDTIPDSSTAQQRRAQFITMIKRPMESKTSRFNTHGGII